MKSKLKLITIILITIFIFSISHAELNELKYKYKHQLKLNRPNPGLLLKLDTDETKPETGLRRFEIVFLTSLPLTMFISFTMVQLYEMQQQKTTTPNMSKENLQFVIGFSVTSSMAIAIKDLIRWKRSKKKDDEGK